MIKIEVKASSPYEVVIGKGILNDLGEAVKKVAEGNKALIVTDDIVEKLYLKTVLSSLKKAGFDASDFVIPHGEENKNLSTYEKVLNALAEKEFTRQDTVIALGGGVVGDIAGFAASSYMRGIGIIQVPTTLLSAIDSSVGGKTGVNLNSGKNLAGAFHQPSLVFCDISTLSSLPESEWKNGIGEGVKYAVLCGGELLEILESGLKQSNLERFIELAVSYKRDIVIGDEKESGQRKLLNLGHTFGHAIEKLSGYKIPHGEAVVKGIVIVVKLALAGGELNAPDAERIMNIIKKYKFNTSAIYGKSEITEVLKIDKKVEPCGFINYINIRGIGDCAVQKIKLDKLGDDLDEM